MNTTEPMPQEQLDAIQERVDYATPGPWEAGGRCVFANNPHRPYDAYAVVSDEVVNGAYGVAISRTSDVDLIANAPQDLTDLLAEVERLSQRVGDLEYVAAQARKAVERLRTLTTVDDAKIERVARELAQLESGEAWPTTRELGGVPRSGRDEEYRDAMREWAQKVINISLGGDEDEW